MQSVLVAIDGSDGGERALDTAIELAKRYSSGLIIVTVEQGYPHGTVSSAALPDNASMEEVLYAASSEILTRAQEKAKALGVRDISCHGGLGDPAGFVLEIAKRENPEFVVVGKRGRGRVSGLLLGSVSQKLVSAAPGKVLVVP